MKHSFLPILILVALGAVAVKAEEALGLRDPSVLYLDDNLPEPLLVRLPQAADIFFDRNFQGRVATLPARTEVRLLGIHPDGWLVKASHGGNTVEGWMERSKLPAPDKALIEQAKANQARRIAVEAAVKEHKVIDDMTPEEVRRSLGRPNRTSSRKDQAGKVEVWSFISYEQVPQYQTTLDSMGRTTSVLTYIKVPVGEIHVEFQDGRVTAVEEKREADPGRTIRVK